MEEFIQSLYRYICFTGPSIYDVHTKIGFLTLPLPVHMRPHEPYPLVEVHMTAEKNDRFSWKSFGFWVSGRQIFYISSAKISDDRSFSDFFHKKILFPHVNRVKF